MSSMFILADQAGRLSTLLTHCNSREDDALLYTARLEHFEPAAEPHLQFCEIVILDHGAATASRAQLVEQIREVNEAARVLVTGIPDQVDARRTELIFEYLEYGAAGYVTEAAMDQLPEAIDEIARGGAWIEPAMTTELVQRTIALRDALTTIKPHSVAAGQPDVLTRRQTEVLELLAAGLTNRQIADALYISVGTVKNHVHRILDVLQASSRDQAAEYYHFLHTPASSAAA